MPSKHLLNKWAEPAGGQQLANSSPKSHGQWRQDVSPGWGLWAPPLNRLSLVPNPHFTGKQRLRERGNQMTRGRAGSGTPAPSAHPVSAGLRAGRPLGAHMQHQKPGQDGATGSQGPAASSFPWLLPFPKRDGAWLVFPAPKDQEGALLSQRCRV